MDHNIFEKNGTVANGETLSHEDQSSIMAAAATDASGSFRKYVIAHAQDYGIKNVEAFFPDAVTVRDEPDMYKRDTEWVANVLTNTHHTPFSRIRSQYVDLTEDAARAKGFTLDRDNNHRKTDEMIKARVIALLEKYQLRYTVEWWLSGQPFLTQRGKLVDAVVNAIEHYNEIKPQLLTTGGTSDGRFIARMGAQVVELGPVNATIHKINECVNAADLQLLARMYQRIMEQIVA